MDALISLLVICRSQAQFNHISQLLAQVHHTDYQLHWINRLDDALPAMLKWDCDLVLLDYHWSKGRALEVLKHARAQGYTRPIVVMTDEMEAEVDRVAISLGASDYLIKGRIDSQLLERTLRYAIERSASEQKLARLAHYDVLTQLPNRALFRERLEHTLHVSKREDTAFALMYLDLNDFKQINDVFGHDAGDFVLKCCAERLRECMRKSDTVARLGGDEFVLLLTQTQDPIHIAHVAQKVIHAVEQEISLDGYSVKVGVSIGISIYPAAGHDEQTLCKHADMAMYQAKQERVSAYHFFTEALNLAAKRQLLIETDLRRALHQSQLQQSYRPIVDLQSRTLQACMVRIVWDHPQRGALQRRDFMSIAEESSLIIPLGYWSFQQASLHWSELAQRGKPLPDLLFELSVQQLVDLRLSERLHALLGERLSPESITLVLSEEDLLLNGDRIQVPMQTLSELGYRFALSDFGRGPTSIRDLQRLPVDTVILSPPLLQTMSHPSDQALAEALVGVARTLGMRVLADSSLATADAFVPLQQWGCEGLMLEASYSPSTLPYQVDTLPVADVGSGRSRPR